MFQVLVVLLVVSAGGHHFYISSDTLQVSRHRLQVPDQVPGTHQQRFRAQVFAILIEFENLKGPCSKII